MIRWGYDLMQENHLPEAIDVLFPSSANGYDSLGEAYMKGEEAVGN